MVAYKSSRTKEKTIQLGNPKSSCGCLWELFITKFKSQFKWGLPKVVATRAGCLQKWSQGELRLYDEQLTFSLNRILRSPTLQRITLLISYCSFTSQPEIFLFKTSLSVRAILGNTGPSQGSMDLAVLGPKKRSKASVSQYSLSKQGLEVVRYW